MGLRESRIINSVHPWLAVRLKWLEEVAVIVGSRQSLISGNRTIEQQRALYDTVVDRPVAYPGCSQHNYGFAADATYLPIVLISSKGRPAGSTAAQTTAFFNSAARHVGLTLVRRDDGHYQIYPGIQFREWAVSQGFCNPNPPPSAIDRLVNQIMWEHGNLLTKEIQDLLDLTNRTISRR